MYKTLIFIETNQEISAIEEYSSSDILVVAMFPSVALELKKRSIPFVNTKSLYGANGHKVTLEHSKSIVEKIRPLLEKVESNGFQNTLEKTWIVFFRVNLHYWLVMLFIINNSVKYYKPNKIIVVRNNNRDDHSLNSIVEQYALSNKIHIQYSNQVVSSNRPTRKYLLILNLLSKIIFELQFKFFKLLLRKKNVFFALNDSSNMPRFFERLRSHADDFFPVYLSIQKKTINKRLIESLNGKSFSFLSFPKKASNQSTEIFKKKYNKFVNNLTNLLNNSKSISIIYGVNLKEQILWCTENELKNRMFDLNADINTLQRLFSSLKPKAVFSQHSLGVGYALGEISFKESIPGLLITHGSHVPQKKQLPKYEWTIHSQTIFNAMYSFVAIQTPWAKKFLLDQASVVSKPIETGPLIFANFIENNFLKPDLRKKLFGENQVNKRIILHASSPRAWQSYRPWIYETIDEYIYNINSIIESVDKLSNIYLCIRFREQEGLSLDDFKASLHKSKCYGVYCEGLFEDYLLSSDLLISYSSTTIEEALQNHIPVLQYDPDGKYEHIPGKIIGNKPKDHVSSLYSVHNKKNLLPTLEWWQLHHTNDKNKYINWREHSYDSIDDLDWVKKMKIKL